MANLFTLDKLREDVSKEFAPVKIGLSDGTEVTLRNLLRLGKKDRETVLEKLKVLESVGEKKDDDEAKTTIEDLDRLAEAGNDILLLVADHGRKLVKELDGDFALILRVVETWMEATQPGEAQPSPA